MSTNLVLQHDTYHPLLPFIPAKLEQRLPPTKPCCAVGSPSKPCSVACRTPQEKNTAHYTKLLLCSRCKAVSYCGRDHQKADFANHKHVCRYVEKCRKKMNALAAKLPQALFTDRVGQIWQLVETQPFLYAKRDYMLALTVTRTFEGVTLALAQGFDCLRLNRDDNLGIRNAVPALMLQLGQLQECYDFIKWWATFDPRELVDIKDPSVPMFTVKNADMAEKIPMDFYDRRTSVFHWAALAFIKIQLALTAQTELDIQVEAAKHPKAESGTLDVLMSLLKMDTMSAMEKECERLKLTAEDAMIKVGSLNKHFWPSVLDPHVLSGDVSRGFFVRGGRFEVQNWLVPHGLLWSQHPVLKPFMLLWLATSGSA